MARGRETLGTFDKRGSLFEPSTAHLKKPRFGGFFRFEDGSRATAAAPTRGVGPLPNPGSLRF
jgi:hypothetical protein